MKFILIATALNLQITYPNENICNVALDAVKEKDTTAFCIPAGEDQSDATFRKFFDLIQELQKNQVDQTGI